MGSLVIQPEGPALKTWPASPRAGERIHIAFVAPSRIGDGNWQVYEITVHDTTGRRVATVVHGRVRAVGGVVCVWWDGRLEGGLAAPGRYLLRVAKPGSGFAVERTIAIEP